MSPIVTVDGRYNRSTTAESPGKSRRGCETDEEKALAIFNRVRTHGDHQYSGDIQALNPVVFCNVFGHGIRAFWQQYEKALHVDTRTGRIDYFRIYAEALRVTEKAATGTLCSARGNG